MSLDPSWLSFIQRQQNGLNQIYPQWRSVFDQMEQRKLPSRLTMQVVVSPYLNAHATLFLRSGRNVIGVSSTLIHYFMRLAEIAALHFPFSTATIENVQQDHASGEIFANILLGISGFTPLKLLPAKEPVEHDRVKFSRMFSRLALGQVIGHELAHIWLGHLAETKETTVVAGVAGDEDADVAFRSQKMEVEADFWGMIAQMSWADKSDVGPALAIISGDFMLAGLEFWENIQKSMLWPIASKLQDISANQGIQRFFTVPEPPKDYPPMAVRRIMMRDRLLQALGSEVAEQSEVTIGYRMGAHNSDFMAALWQAARPSFEVGLEKSLQRRR